MIKPGPKAASISAIIRNQLESLHIDVTKVCTVRLTDPVRFETVIVTQDWLSVMEALKVLRTGYHVEHRAGSVVVLSNGRV